MTSINPKEFVTYGIQFDKIFKIETIYDQKLGVLINYRHTFSQIKQSKLFIIRFVKRNYINNLKQKENKNKALVIIIEEVLLNQCYKFESIDGIVTYNIPNRGRIIFDNNF